jgi:hypothetical protein
MTAGATGAKLRLLIVTMGTDYIAPARMPYELQRAGFHVALIAPREALATQTAHVDRIDCFPPGVTLLGWIAALSAAVDAVQPALILPGDDVALRTLMQIVLGAPAGEHLAPLIRRSLGDPEGWIDSIDKTRLFELAQREGVAVAEGGVAADDDEAVALANALGYPVIVRSDYGSAGEGSMRCHSAAEVRSALATPGATGAWVPAGPRRVLVQRWIDGAIVNRSSLAWDGAEIAGFTRGRLETHPSPLGPASVVEFVGIPGVAAATRTLFAALRMHGMIGTQFVVANDVAYLIEINRRMLPAAHSGSRVGVDLAQALHAVARGAAWTGPRDLPEGKGLRLALFPQEWIRNPASPWLGTLACDAPWHDPRLFAAMLRLAQTAISGTEAHTR